MTSLFSKRRRTAALIAAAASISVPVAQSGADISGFTSAGTGPTEFTLNGNAAATTVGVPSISGTTLNLTTAVNSQATSAFYNTQQSLNNWTSTFTYTKGTSSANPADGFAFVLQTDPRGLTALGASGGAVGYSGTGAIINSTAVGFDIYNGGNAANPTRTGLGVDGSGFAFVNSTPVNLRTGNPIQINLSYNNGVVTQSMTDTVTNETFQRSFNARIEARVGSSGFVGFTGGTGGANAAQTISNFSFTTGNAPAAPVLTTPTFLSGAPAGGAGFFGVREVTANGNVTNISETEQSLQTERAPTRRIVDYTAPSLDIYDSDNRGDFSNDRPFASAASPGPGVGSVDNLAMLANGRIRVPTAGYYTFSVRGDDGFRLSVAGQRFEAALGQGGTQTTADGSLQFPNGRGAGERSFGQIYLPSGDHNIQLLQWEGTGGASVELSAAAGLHTTFNNSFNLVGAPAVTEVRQNRTRFTGTSTGFTTVRSNTLDPTLDGKGKAISMLYLTSQHRGSPGSTTVDASATSQLVNFNDTAQAGAPRTGGSIPTAVEPPGGNPSQGEDNYGLGSYGTLSIPANRTGRYTFNVHADDISIFRIFGPNGSLVPLQSTNRERNDTDFDGIDDAHLSTGANQDSLGRYDLTAGGNYTIEVAMQEGGGGSHFQLFGAIGDWNEFGDQFQLIGQNFDDQISQVITAGRPQGLQLVDVPEPGSISVAVLAVAGLLTRRRRTSRVPT